MQSQLSSGFPGGGPGGCLAPPHSSYGGTRFFIIRSSSAHNVNVAIDKGVWATIQRNEQKLAQAVMEAQRVVLFFRVLSAPYWSGYAIMKNAPGQGAYPSSVFAGRGGKPFFGKTFDVQWISTAPVSIDETRGIFNKCNRGESVNRAMDGQPVDEEAGVALCQLFDAKDASGNVAQMASASSAAFPQPRALALQTGRALSFPGDLQQPALAEVEQWGAAQRFDAASSLHLSAVPSHAFAITQPLAPIPAYPAGVYQPQPSLHFPPHRRAFVKEEPCLYTAVPAAPGEAAAASAATRAEAVGNARLAAAPQNPAMRVFPIDLTCMTYDDYIEVYEASKEMWQNIFRQHEMQQQLQLKSTEASAATSSDADVKAEATLDRTAPTAEGGEALSLDAKPELSEEQSERPEDGARPSAEGGEVSAEEENAQSGRELSTGESQLGGSSAVVVKTEVED